MMDSKYARIHCGAVLTYISTGEVRVLVVEIS